MEIRQLKHFVAVAEARNFHRAAETQNLSQQAISKSILQLERSLSVKLFERGRQYVLLTSEGESLLEYARDILADVRRFDDALADSMGRQFGHLKIGATPNFLSAIIPDTLAVFHQRFPQARVTVERGDFATLRDRLLQGDIDLVLSSAPSQAAQQLVSLKAFARDRNLVVVRKGHPLSQKATVTPKMLAAFPLLSIQNYPRGEAYRDRIFAGKIAPKSMIDVGSSDLAVRWVMRSDFWWIPTFRQVEHLIRSHDLCALPVEPADEGWDLTLAQRRNAQMTRVMFVYQEILLEHMSTIKDIIPPQ